MDPTVGGAGHRALARQAARESQVLLKNSAGILPSLLASWSPGTEGAGVADVLFGGCAPTGKLPMTWMNSASQQPINAGDGQIPLFPPGLRPHVLNKVPRDR